MLGVFVAIPVIATDIELFHGIADLIRTLQNIVISSAGNRKTERGSSWSAVFKVKMISLEKYVTRLALSSSAMTRRPSALRSRLSSGAFIVSLTSEVEISQLMERLSLCASAFHKRECFGHDGVGIERCKDVPEEEAS